MVFAPIVTMGCKIYDKLKIFLGSEAFKNQDHRYILYGISTVYFIVFSLALYYLYLGKTIIGLFDLLISFTLLLFCIRLWNTKEIHYLNRIVVFICIMALISTAYFRWASSLLWAFPFISIIFLLVNKNIALVITLLSLTATFPFVFDHLSAAFMLSLYPSLLLASIFQFLIASKTDFLQHNLYEIAAKDGLTRVLNRRSLNNKVEEVIANNSRSNQQVALLIFDLDKFKNINDLYGHAEGDNILIGFANIIKTNIRTSDFLYRYGGEEFVVLAFNTEISDAADLSEHLRTTVENDPLFKQYNLTVSIGVSQIEVEDCTNSWLERADTALFKAKTSGRNRVFVANRCKRPGKNTYLSYTVFSELFRERNSNTSIQKCYLKGNKKNVYLFKRRA